MLSKEWPSWRNPISQLPLFDCVCVCVCMYVCVCVCVTTEWHCIIFFSLWDGGGPPVNPASLILSGSLATIFQWALRPRSSRTVANENKQGKKTLFLVNPLLLIQVEMCHLRWSITARKSHKHGHREATSLWIVYFSLLEKSLAVRLTEPLNKGCCVCGVSWVEWNHSPDCR